MAKLVQSIAELRGQAFAARGSTAPNLPLFWALASKEMLDALHESAMNRGPENHPKSRNTKKKSPCLVIRELFQKVRANFCYFASSPEKFCEYFFRICLGTLH